MTEAKELVAATRQSSSIYMLAENYGYQAPNVLINALVAGGLFGEVYQAEGEYIHELKQMLEDTPWRRSTMTSQPGITYPTHSLGPILEWMRGDRVDRLTAADTGSHFRDPKGVPYHHDSATILAKTVAGRLIKLRFDLISDRPHSMSNYQLQGTDGAYESGRSEGDWGRLWLRGLTRKVEWMDPRTLLLDRGLVGRYLPEWYLRDEATAMNGGHGGGDFFVISRFCQAIRGEIPNPCDVHAALDMTLPGLISQDPSAGERWLSVPDSRTW